MTFDEYEQKQHEVDMFKMQVQCAICGVLGINAGDTDGSTFHFRRVSDTDIEYHIDYVDGRRKSIDRKLDIKLDVADVVRPDTDIAVKAKVAFKDGKPASGLIHLFAVDEGILALTDFHTPDIFDFFHGQRYFQPEFFDS